MYESNQKRYREFNPQFSERTAEGIKTWDPSSKLFESRIIMLAAPLDGAVSANIISQLLVLNQLDPDEPISLYVNSPGGDYESALAIYDTMQFINNPISTVCIGEATGVASLILAAGQERIALPHARITIASFNEEGERGQATDIAIRAELLERKFNAYASAIARETGQPLEAVKKNSSRQFHLTPEEAIEYGILDSISAARKPAKKLKG